MPSDKNDKLSRVLNLEERRKAKGRQPGWLYHRCLEQDLLKELKELEQQGLIDRWKNYLSDKEILNSSEFKKLTSIDKQVDSTFEILPETCHLQNLRTLLSQSNWQRIRKLCLEEASYRCKLCDFKPKNKSKLDCHESWYFDDKKGEQKLHKLMVLCQDCHAVKHLDFHSKFRKDKLINHFVKLTGNLYTQEEALESFESHKELAIQRGQMDWMLNVSSLAALKIMPVPEVLEKGVDLESKRRRRKKNSKQQVVSSHRSESARRKVSKPSSIENTNVFGYFFWGGVSLLFALIVLWFVQLLIA